MSQLTFNPNDFFTITASSHVAVVKLHGDVYSLVTDVVKSDYFISKITEINQTDALKGLLILHDDGIFDRKGYRRFMEGIIDPESLHETWPRFRDPRTRFGMMHAINRLIRTIIDFKKLFLVGLSGEVVSPFFGISMAADMRYGAENLSFVLDHRHYGLHPSGALPYFLSKFLHHSKALEIMLRNEPIEAQEALETGLVNQLLPTQQFEQQCLDQALALCDIRHSTLFYTKRLLNHTRDDLKDYLDYEAQLINL
jgi:enoyl-CoA hydratase/carnithine racemase